MATERQMLARMNEEHRRILAGRVPPSMSSIGTIRGHMKARSTLIQWGALSWNPETKAVSVTELGTRLLQEWPKWWAEQQDKRYGSACRSALRSMYAGHPGEPRNCQQWDRAISKLEDVTQGKVRDPRPYADNY